MKERPRIGFYFTGLTYGGVEKWMADLCSIGFPVSGVALEGQYFSHEVGKKFPARLYCHEQYFLPNYTKTRSLKESFYRVAMDSDIMIIPSGSWEVLKFLNESNVPTILSCHGTGSDTKRVVQEGYRHVDYYHAVSPDAATCFPSMVRDKVSVIYNGVHPVSKQLDRKEAKRLLGFSQDTKVLLYVGRLGREKNPRALLQALLKLPPNWVGIYVGTGDLGHVLFEEAAAFVPDRVAFLPPNTDLSYIYPAADVFLLPSDTEGFPYVLLEAITHSLPVVATNTPPVRDLISSHQFDIFSIPIRPQASALASAVQTADGTSKVSKNKAKVDQAFNITNFRYLWTQLLSAVYNNTNGEFLPVFANAPKPTDIPYL